MTLGPQVLIIFGYVAFSVIADNLLGVLKL